MAGQEENISNKNNDVSKYRRLLGLDIGDRRLGTAVLEEKSGVIAPLRIIERGKGHDDWGALARIIKTQETSGFVAGMPLLPSGEEGEQARKVRGYLKALRQRYPGAPLYLVDERDTTVEAEEALQDAGWTAAQRKNRRDAEAAAAILRRFRDEGSMEEIEKMKDEG